MKFIVLKRVAVGVVFLASITSIFAQTTLDISMPDEKKLMVNGSEINPKTNFTNVKALFGEMSSEKEKGGGKEYIFESSGVIVSTSAEGFVKGIGININWDGDKNFPKTAYSGTLSIGGTPITASLKSEEVAKLKGVEFACPFPLLCASKNNKAAVRSMIGFSSKNVLTQVIFILQ